LLDEKAKAVRYAKSITHGALIEQVIPGGVDSPFRAFGEVGGQAVFFERGEGAYLWDLDGNKYIDYLGAWGPAIAGHAPPEVTTRAIKALEAGPVFGAPHQTELELARAIIGIVPQNAVEMMRFVSSGTEAVMSAIRLARGYTNRELIVMFEGGYHGHSDATLASTTHSSSAGVPKGMSQAALQARYNDLNSVAKIFDEHPGKIAAVIVEPVCGSMGVVVPQGDFLKDLAALCLKHDVLLIFDEVITGFRLAIGGAQQYFGIKADIVCYGKALGGGMPIGAFGGSRAIMSKMLPLGDVYQAGTFSGNPLTMSAALATIEHLKASNPYPYMDELGARLELGLERAIDHAGHPATIARAGSMFSINFAKEPVTDLASSKAIDKKAYARFFHYCLDNGIYLPPSAEDAACISAKHTKQDIDHTLEVMVDALKHAFA